MDEDELEAIVSYPSARNLFRLNSFESFDDSFRRTFRETVCNSRFSRCHLWRLNEQRSEPIKSLKHSYLVCFSIICQIVSDINECASNPCRNAVTCNDALGYYWCLCLDRWGGVDCSEREP